MNVVINNDNNIYNSLMSGGEEINYAKMTFAKVSIAFKLTRVNLRLDIIRARIIRENTHIMKTNEDLTRVNAIL